MNIKIYNSIGEYLSEPIIKTYSAGVGSIVKRNKINYADDIPRSMYKIDYSTLDIQAIQNFRVEAFTVAGVGSFKLEEEIKAIAEDVWKNKNQDTAEFTRRALAKQKEYAPFKNTPPGAWLNTNFNTSVGGSYSGAQFIRLQDADMQKLYPAYKYMTRNDGVVRPEHAVLHGKIYRADDKIWLIIWTPNGWNCRCFIIPLSIAEFEAAGLSVEGYTNEETRKEIIKEAGISKDFNRNPGATMSIWDKWLKSGLREIDVELIRQQFVQHYESNKKIFNADLEIEKIKEANKLLGKDERINIKDYAGQPLIINADRKIKQTILNVVMNPSEVWGRTYNNNGVTNSQVNYIQYLKGEAVCVTSINGIITEIKKVKSAEEINKLRRGTIMKM